MLTEQQLVFLRSEPGSNRVAKAMALAGVTQVTVAKELAPPDAALRQRCRPRALSHHYRRERLEVRCLLRLPYRGFVPVTPATVGLNEDQTLEAPLPGRRESHYADPGLVRRERPRAPSHVFER